MLAKERHAIIMEILRKDKIIKISDISRRFSVSNETARRDLEYLQDTEQLKRIYGGAILLGGNTAGLHQAPHAHVRRSQKSSIGRAAASLVNSGETIILDIGSTTLEIARHLSNISGITVLTNSLPIMNELAGTQVTVYCLGGRLNSDELSMYGKVTTDALQQFFVDRAFIGAGGVTLEHGISDYNSEEAIVRQAIIKRANQTVLVADSAKFGTNAFASVCTFNDIDVVVSDENLSREFREGLSKWRNLELILAPAVDEPDEEEDV